MQRLKKSSKLNKTLKGRIYSKELLSNTLLCRQKNLSSEKDLKMKKNNALELPKSFILSSVLRQKLNQVNLNLNKSLKVLENKFKKNNSQLVYNQICNIKSMLINFPKAIKICLKIDSYLVLPTPIKLNNQKKKINLKKTKSPPNKLKCQLCNKRLDIHIWSKTCLDCLVLMTTKLIPSRLLLDDNENILYSFLNQNKIKSDSDITTITASTKKKCLIDQNYDIFTSKITYDDSKPTDKKIIYTYKECVSCNKPNINEKRITNICEKCLYTILYKALNEHIYFSQRFKCSFCNIDLSKKEYAKEICYNCLIYHLGLFPIDIKSNLKNLSYLKDKTKINYIKDLQDGSFKRDKFSLALKTKLYSLFRRYYDEDKVELLILKSYYNAYGIIPTTNTNTETNTKTNIKAT